MFLYFLTKISFSGVKTAFHVKFQMFFAKKFNDELYLFWVTHQAASIHGSCRENYPLNSRAELAVLGSKENLREEISGIFVLR